MIGNDELRNGLKEHVGIELTDEEFRLCLNVVDRDGSGEIEYNELSRAIKYGDPARVGGDMDPFGEFCFVVVVLLFVCLLLFVVLSLFF